MWFQERCVIYLTVITSHTREYDTRIQTTHILLKILVLFCCCSDHVSLRTPGKVLFYNIVYQQSIKRTRVYASTCTYIPLVHTEGNNVLHRTCTYSIRRVRNMCIHVLRGSISYRDGYLSWNTHSSCMPHNKQSKHSQYIQYINFTFVCVHIRADTFYIIIKYYGEHSEVYAVRNM